MDRNRQIANSPDRDPYVLQVAEYNATSCFRQAVELVLTVGSRQDFAGMDWLKWRDRLQSGMIAEEMALGYSEVAATYFAHLTVWAVERVADGTADESRVAWVKIDGQWRMSLVTIYE